MTDSSVLHPVKPTKRRPLGSADFAALLNALLVGLLVLRPNGFSAEERDDFAAAPQSDVMSLGAMRPSTALKPRTLLLTLLPLATAVTLNYTSAIFLAIYLALAGMHLRVGILGALGVGLVGVALLLKPTLHADQLTAGLIGLGSGILAGMAYFSVRELGARGEPEVRTVFYFSLVSSCCAALWLLFSDLHPVHLRSGLLLLGVACFATLAQLAMTRAYTRGKTLLSAALAYSTVIFSSLLGALFWGEVLDASVWFAIGLIIVSGIAATHFSRASPGEQD